ncbi:protein VACUOLELESS GAMETOPHYTES [Cornus florida]|uniref:protein VACUOLELESS GAMETOPHYTES n=1 Tax=Cornus florida TaxID=4283 RepID=UPI00289BC8F8|nr:protein VACUOLELESS GAMETOPHYTES [Cornus florida]
MEYKHFSHQHSLMMYQVQQGQQLRCSGCESYCHDSVYACWPCNFFLHQHCGNANRYVKHPSHPLHPLILLPSPTYCSATFLCNACGAPGNAFSYCCALCEIDLHVHCAFLPPKVTHNSHPHQLGLICTNPADKVDQNTPNCICKICNKLLESKHWAYDCSKCDLFLVHTYCATKEVKLGLYPDDAASDSEAVPQNGCEGQPEVELTEDAVVELYKLQLQMQMADQFAQMMSSFNLTSLA